MTPNIDTQDQDMSSRCRLCGAKTRHVFTKRVMHKIDVQYFCCNECGSLETETPYWLDEAYNDARRFTDTGVAQRAQCMQAACYFLLKILKADEGTRLLDWGGGCGLTTRLFRDAGLDAYCYDRIAINTFAPGFDYDSTRHFDIMTSFEVWEHLSQPCRELADFFQFSPKIVFISTCLYQGQGADWSYLAPYAGRHVFFYSPQGMEWIANKYQYHLEMLNNVALLTKNKLTWFQRLAVRLVMKKHRSRMLRVAFLLFVRHTYSGSDYETMMRRVAS